MFCLGLFWFVLVWFGLVWFGKWVVGSFVYCGVGLGSGLGSLWNRGIGEWGKEGFWTMGGVLG